jgi:cell shape-determining protein MreC
MIRHEFLEPEYHKPELRMKRIIVRISLIVSIVACVAVFALELTQLRGKLTNLNNRLTAQTVAREKAEADFVNARQEANKTAIALKHTAETLDAKTAQVSAQADQIAKLTNDAKKLRENLNDAQAELAAYKSLMTPEQVAHAAKHIKELEDSVIAMNEENALLGRRLRVLQRDLPGGEKFKNPLPPDLSTKVLAVDPKWQFVVLDAGEEQGVIEHGELLVSRGGKLVAKVRISRVEKNRCVANIMDGWNLAELQEGDQAFPAPNS